MWETSLFCGIRVLNEWHWKSKSNTYTLAYAKNGCTIKRHRNEKDGILWNHTSATETKNGNMRNRSDFPSCSVGRIFLLREICASSNNTSSHIPIQLIQMVQTVHNVSNFSLQNYYFIALDMRNLLFCATHLFTSLPYSSEVTQIFFLFSMS